MSTYHKRMSNKTWKWVLWTSGQRTFLTFPALCFGPQKLSRSGWPPEPPLPQLLLSHTRLVLCHWMPRVSGQKRNIRDFVWGEKLKGSLVNPESHLFPPNLSVTKHWRPEARDTQCTSSGGFSCLYRLDLIYPCSTLPGVDRKRKSMHTSLHSVFGNSSSSTSSMLFSWLIAK